MNNLIIALGGTGNNIIKMAAKSKLLSNVKMYAIDSITSSIELDNITNINHICIVADSNEGSGRDRTRGAAMYRYHEDNGTFDQMYEDAENAKAPVIVITSAAGGTGSGSIIPVCEALRKRSIQVIPIIICPNMKDPVAYHLNTTDLFIELDEVGIETYSVFRNTRGDADYTPVNEEVVDLIEIIFGRRYGHTELDSIDDSDLDVILNTPGRFIAVSASAANTAMLRKEITRKVLSGFQPAWTDEDAANHTLITAYSLTSIFANTEFKNVFEEINNRLDDVYDEYRNIVNDDNDGVSDASIIIAGLPRPELKIIDTEFKDVTNIANGMNRSKRPKFVNRKKASVDQDTQSQGDAISKFKWR